MGWRLGVAALGEVFVDGGDAGAAEDLAECVLVAVAGGEVGAVLLAELADGGGGAGLLGGGGRLGGHRDLGARVAPQTEGCGRVGAGLGWGGLHDGVRESGKWRMEGRLPSPLFLRKVFSR